MRCDGERMQRTGDGGERWEMVKRITDAGYFESVRKSFSQNPKADKLALNHTRKSL